MELYCRLLLSFFSISVSLYEGGMKSLYADVISSVDGQWDSSTASPKKEVCAKQRRLWTFQSTVIYKGNELD